MNPNNECIRFASLPLNDLPIYSTHLRLPTYDRLNASYGLGNYSEFATSYNSVPPSCRIFLMFVIPTNLLISTSLHSDLIEYNWLRKWELNPTTKVMSLVCDRHTASAILCLHRDSNPNSRIKSPVHEPFCHRGN